jgi:hypothetical protein
MARADDLRAELAMVELEAKLVEAKLVGLPAAKLSALKHEVRAARQAHREQREVADAAEGTARPGTVTASATVKKAR